MQCEAWTGRRMAMAAGMAAALALGGCGGFSFSKENSHYDQQEFRSDGDFSRTFPVSTAQACEAVRRTLLSQGYVVTTSRVDFVSATKAFQPQGETHLEITFHVVCAPERAVDGNPRSTIFASALQDRFALRKASSSASLGVGVLGSVSLPFFASDDSMVKVASLTISSKQFYDRFYGLVGNDLAQIPDDDATTGHELDVDPKTSGDGTTDAAGAAAPRPAAPPAGTTAPATGGGQ